MEDTRLGAILLEGGIVDEAALERCLAIQSLTGGVRPIGQILVEQRLLDPATLKRLLDLQRSRVALRRAEVAAADAMSGTLLRAATANGASELVVSEGRPVRIRVAGEWRELAPEPLRGPEVWDFVRELMGPEVLEELADRHSVVRAWQDPELGHGAATAFRQFDGVAVRLTFAARGVLTPMEAAVPPAAVDAVRGGRGLVLLVAERGAGRVDALASLLQVACGDKGHYAVALDDEPLPLTHGGSLVVRRRFGLLPADRTAALRSALREDPDVLSIADVGDPETFELALRAAEGGRLVIACIDAGSVVDALHRVTNFYAAYDVPRVQQSLAAALKVVVARHLLPDVDHAGTIVANELLVVDESVREALRCGGIDDIGLLLRMEGARCGHSLDRSLLELVEAGRVRIEDVFARAEDKALLLSRTQERTTTTR